MGVDVLDVDVLGIESIVGRVLILLDLPENLETSGWSLVAGISFAKVLHVGVG